MFILETSMLKTLITLFRGRTALIAEEVPEQKGLLILDEQMRDATGAIERAKKALAVAIAQENQEGQRLDATHSRIADGNASRCRDRCRPRRPHHGGCGDR